MKSKFLLICYKVDKSLFCFVFLFLFFACQFLPLKFSGGCLLATICKEKNEEKEKKGVHFVSCPGRPNILQFLMPLYVSIDVV